jgi:hypothetical protein
MLMRPSLTVVPLLAMMLVSPAVQAIGELPSDATVGATFRLSRADLAVLQAPIGHRQPPLNDLPPWLRDAEKPGTEPNPMQGSEQRRMPRVQPDDGLPRICEPC